MTSTSALAPLLQALRSLNPTPPADSRRLFHGRGRCFEGLAFVTLDWFAPVVSMTLFEDPGEAWLSQCREACVPLVAELSSVEALVVQHRYQHGAPSEVWYGELPERVLAEEAGLRFPLFHLGKAQNVGFFLDMRNTRQWLRERVEGRSVLNLFAYTCAFSVVAREAGASKVVNIDMSRPSLSLGRESHRANEQSLDDIHFLGHDIFKSWGKLRRNGPYDVLIVDPPSRQYKSFVAEKDYPRLVKRLVSLSAPGADILLCLNSPLLGYSFLEELMAEHCPEAHYHACLVPPFDFPESEPDRGLKILHYKLSL